MEQRKAELIAMKAKLVEIKRRNAERQQSLSMSRRSVEVHTRFQENAMFRWTNLPTWEEQLTFPHPQSSYNSRESIEALVDSLVGVGARPSSTGPMMGMKNSRPNSVMSAAESSFSDTASPTMHSS